MKVAALVVAATLAAAGPGRAGQSYVAADGMTRSPAVTLHCAGPGGGSAPCGTAAAPLVVAPIGGVLTSRSLALPAGQSVILFPANPSRRYLSFQVPTGTYLWVNLLGGVASPGGIDCAYFGSGMLYESGQFVNTGPVSVYSPVAITVSAWEG